MSAQPARTPDELTMLAANELLDTQADRTARIKLSANLELATREINDAQATLRRPYPLRPIPDTDHLQRERDRVSKIAHGTLDRLTLLRRTLEARLVVHSHIDYGLLYERPCPQCGTDLLYEVSHPPIPREVRRWLDENTDGYSLFFCPACERELVA